MFSLILPAYAEEYMVDEDEIRYSVATIAEKNHFNARNPLAQFRREISAEQICQMAAVAGRLSVFDCAGVADGAAAVIMCRAEDAHKYTDNALYVKRCRLSAPVPVRSTPTTTTRPCPSASGRPTTPTPRPASRHATRSPSPKSTTASRRPNSY